jgi:hypothetical protein
MIPTITLEKKRGGGKERIQCPRYKENKCIWGTYYSKQATTPSLPTELRHSLSILNGHTCGDIDDDDESDKENARNKTKQNMEYRPAIYTGKNVT